MSVYCSQREVNLSIGCRDSYLNNLLKCILGEAGCVSGHAVGMFEMVVTIGLNKSG